jgi:hypothetical protein
MVGKIVSNNQNQLSLFSLTDLDDVNYVNYANTIELYDAIPKYILGKNKFGKGLNPIEREFVHKDEVYRVIIKPTKIKNKSGEYVDALPGQREEFVEDALRKIAIDNPYFKQNTIGVCFTYYQLKKELEKTGHSYSYTELKEAVNILASTSMELKRILTTGKEEELYTENLFSKLAGKTNDNWMDGEHKKSFFIVTFHSLVRKSIIETTFRRYNYEKCMKYTNALARYLHKRMSHNYIQASMLKPYEITASTIISGSGMKKYARSSNNHRYIAEGLDQLKEEKVLETWSFKNQGDDYKYTLIPTGYFVSEVKRTNFLVQEKKSAIEKSKE